MIYENLKGYYSIVGTVVTEDFEMPAFDLALKRFNLHNYNIVKVSSILPKGFKYVKKPVNLPEEGEVLYMAYLWRFFTKKDIEVYMIGENYSIGVWVAEPLDKDKTGLILELEDFCSKTSLKAKGRLMLFKMLKYREGLILNIPKKYKIRSKILEIKFGGKLKKNEFIFKNVGLFIGVPLW